jgi:hypothetical protein
MGIRIIRIGTHLEGYRCSPKKHNQFGWLRYGYDEN